MRWKMYTIQFLIFIYFISTLHPISVLLYKAELGIFKRKVTLFFFPKQHLVVLKGDDTTLSLAERQIKMHPAPSPAPPPAICSSPVICLQPPPPTNKLFVHLCYEQGYWNNQGLKWTTKRKQPPQTADGRWAMAVGEQKEERHSSSPSQAGASLLKCLAPEGTCVVQLQFWRLILQFCYR